MKDLKFLHFASIIFQKGYFCLRLNSVGEGKS